MSYRCHTGSLEELGTHIGTSEMPYRCYSAIFKVPWRCLQGI